MADNATDFIERRQREIELFRKALSTESDRGCALFAAAHLDSSLSELLYVSLVANKKIETDLFEGTAPLATFSSRIKLAYYLGLISQPSRRDLDLIRAIRNDFAHKIDVDSFSTPSVRDRCKALAYSYHEKEEEPRAHFVSAVLRLLGHIHTATLTTPQHQEKPSDVPSEEEKADYRGLLEEMASRLTENRDAGGE